MSATTENRYGALDDLKCFMFIPEDQEFELCFRDIEGIKNHQVFMKNGSPFSITHPGATIGFLRQTGKSLIPHYPFTFACPAVVTFSKSDMKHLAIDADNSRDSAAWPQIEQVQSCPCCRKKTVEDGKTEYVMCMQACTMGGRAPGSIASKMLWRAFCIACFSRIAGQYQGKSVMEMVRWGAGDGIRCPGHAVVKAYERTTAVVCSGLSASIASDFMKWMGLGMGVKAKTQSVERSEKHSDRMLFALPGKVFEACATCGKTSFQVMSEAGLLCEERTKPLMLCGGCKQRRYCSVECSRVDWKAGHKKECREMQALKQGH